MSQKRQAGILDRAGDLKPAITTLSRNYLAGHVVPLHFHERDQVVYASRGVMTVGTRSGTWVVPPHRAVWIPAETPHTIVMSGLVAMRTLYLKPCLAKRLPRDCCVINISTLLKELILYACALRTLIYRKNKNQLRRLCSLAGGSNCFCQILRQRVPNDVRGRTHRVTVLPCR